MKMLRMFVSIRYQNVFALVHHVVNVSSRPDLDSDSLFTSNLASVPMPMHGTTVEQQVMSKGVKAV